MRLRGVAQKVRAVVDGGFGDGGEVHMRGDVLQARQIERVIVRVMAVVAHQRAACALRMVILACAETVIDEQQRAFVHALAQAGDEAARGE